MTAAERLNDAISQVGVPIAQSGASTFLAVAPLYFIPSYVFWVFVVCVTLVVVIGAVHGLIFLPVLFSIFVSPKQTVSAKH
jgi:multidrug efflux pump subunit AcrB